MLPIVKIDDHLIILHGLYAGLGGFIFENVFSHQSNVASNFVFVEQKILKQNMLRMDEIWKKIS